MKPIDKKGRGQSTENIELQPVKKKKGKLQKKASQQPQDQAQSSLHPPRATIDAARASINAFTGAFKEAQAVEKAGPIHRANKLIAYDKMRTPPEISSGLAWRWVAKSTGPLLFTSGAMLAAGGASFTEGETKGNLITAGTVLAGLPLLSSLAKEGSIVNLSARLRAIAEQAAVYCAS